MTLSNQSSKRKNKRTTPTKARKDSGKIRDMPFYRILRSLGLGFAVFISTGLLFLGAWLSRTAANVRCEVIADQARFELTNRWSFAIKERLSINSLPLTYFSIEPIDTPAFKKVNPFFGNVDQQIEEKNVYLSALSITPHHGGGHSIELSAEGSNLTFSAQGAIISGAYDKPALNTTTPADNGMPPETIRFQTQPVAVTPTLMKISPARTWVFTDLHISKIVFNKEIPPGSGHFFSKIKSGQIDILNSGKTIGLDRPRLDGSLGDRWYHGNPPHDD